MAPKFHYHKLRSRYRPTQITLVFLLASPPPSGNYFYDPTGKTTEPLFAGLMRLIGKNPGTTRKKQL